MYDAKDESITDYNPPYTAKRTLFITQALDQYFSAKQILQKKIKNGFSVSSSGLTAMFWHSTDNILPQMLKTC
jgi:hypothetical protein